MRRTDLALQPGEQVRWQACPAPRAYTFRHGRLLLACLGLWLAVLLCLAVSCWRPLLFRAWLPVGGLVLLLPLLARLRWCGERYRVTDRRVLVRRGLWRPRLVEWPLATVVRLELRSLGGSLTDARLWSRQNRQPLTLCCLEQADALAAALGLVPQMRSKSVDRANPA